jgi:hypothetical protein
MSNKYDTTWGQLRRQHGMLWRGNRPGIDDFPSAKTALIIALCVFAMISLIVAVHYQNEATQTAVMRCDIQGQSVWPNAKAHFYFNNDTGLGYGKTVAVCNGVELIGV